MTSTSSASKQSKSSSVKNKTSSSSSSNLILEGSPAPKVERCRPRPKNRLQQPPNSPNCSQLKIRPPPLPLDKIMLVRERLELETVDKSSGHELSLDFSSINDSEHETDDDSECSPRFLKLPFWKKSQSCDETTSTSDTTTSDPQRFVCQWRPCSPDQSPSYPVNTTARTSSRITELPSDECLSKSSSSNLMSLYMDTLKNKDYLSRYFRICESCQNPCCICAEGKEPTSGRSSRCSEFSHFLIERFRNEKISDSGASTLHSTETGKSASFPHNVSLYIMQLTTAANCARMLADSLNSMLEIVREEMSAGSAPSVLAKVDGKEVELLTSALEAMTNFSKNNQGN